MKTFQQVEKIWEKQNFIGIIFFENVRRHHKKAKHRFSKTILKITEEEKLKMLAHIKKKRILYL